MCPLAVISLPLTAIGLSTQNAPGLRLVLPRSRVTQLGSSLDLCDSTDYTLSPESFTPTQSHDEDTDAPQSLENNSLHVCVCEGITGQRENSWVFSFLLLDPGEP